MGETWILLKKAKRIKYPINLYGAVPGSLLPRVCQVFSYPVPKTVQNGAAKR